MRKLTETEEKTLLQWIFIIDKFGAPLRFNTIQNMADLLLAERNTLKPPLTIGINWV